jgi:tetraacyldisaccharide 4'-kinase
MRARLERFFLAEWQRVSAWQLLLQPLSWLYWLIIRARHLCYRLGVFRIHAARVPIIVVGNISVGGTGKTPLVLALTKYLQQQNMRPGIVTRGYQNPHHNAPATMVMHVVPPTSLKTSVSDEAELLVKRSGAPVVIDQKRVDAIARLLNEHADTNVIVSDDGLQHTAMARDIEIAVIDGARGLGNGFLLPAGPLRESSARLVSVDCIILNNTNIGGQFEANMAENARQMAYLPKHIPTFAMTYGAEQFLRVSSMVNARSNIVHENALTIATFLTHCQGKKIAAIAGIGNPPRFFTHLVRLGLTLASTHAFPDHHAYQRQDIAAIDADIIIMTEKDAVKCVSFADQRLWQMQIDALLPDAFYQFMDEKIAHVTRSKAA